MGTFGATEIIIIIAVLVLFFGAKKIPELARGIGEGMKEFKKATNDQLDDDKNGSNNKSDSNEVKQAD
ncbi:MAG: twin-arginine translocase TatA/TatE family subunit [Balneolaceae bacterium]|nr:twin-arginine translocase TatA/TatE family subunit [Balneolaceae bacterium]